MQPWIRPWIAVLLTACSPAIELPAVAELEVRQVGFGPRGAVELSFKLVIRAEAYLLFYDDDEAGEPYEGRGLTLVRWPAGCGDFDGGSDQAPLDLGPPPDATLDLGPLPDAPWPGAELRSPLRIPAPWCLDRAESFTDAGKVPVETPGMRPRVRLSGLVAGRTYHFAARVRRREAEGPLSLPVSIQISAVKP